MQCCPLQVSTGLNVEGGCCSKATETGETFLLSCSLERRLASALFTRRARNGSLGDRLGDRTHLNSPRAREKREPVKLGPGHPRYSDLRGRGNARREGIKVNLSAGKAADAAGYKPATLFIS